MLPQKYSTCMPHTRWRLAYGDWLAQCHGISNRQLADRKDSVVDFEERCSGDIGA